jgi:hypothetical protein
MVSVLLCNHLTFLMPYCLTILLSFCNSVFQSHSLSILMSMFFLMFICPTVLTVFTALLSYCLYSLWPNVILSHTLSNCDIGVQWSCWYLIKWNSIWYQNEFKNLEPYKSFVFKRKLLLKGFNKILHKINSFCSDESEWNEAKWNFMLKRAFFQGEGKITAVVSATFRQLLLAETSGN